MFVHLTYKDAVNLEQIKQVDPLLYTQTIRQIDNYGQTPLQLFDKPHPERLGLDQVCMYVCMLLCSRSDSGSGGEASIQSYFLTVYELGWLG